MTLSQLGFDGADYLKFADLENMFGVFHDDMGRYFFNLNETVYIYPGREGLREYVASYEMQWPLVSYAIYKTTRLAWLLMKVNQVPASRMFDTVKPGQKVLYVDSGQASEIARKVNGIG